MIGRRHIERGSPHDPQRPVLCGAHETLSPAAVDERVERLAAALRRAAPPVRMLGILADNGPDWVVIDLAAERIGLPLVPLPAFFTPAQLLHAVVATGMDALFCASTAAAGALGFGPAGALDGVSIPWLRRADEPALLPAGTSKITFTSGTTGTPKGVCLGAAHQRVVAHSLVAATKGLGIERHLSLLPLPVLLENVAGAAAPMLAGATCCVPPLVEVGLSGATAFDPRACLAAIARWQAHSVILLPQMMVALTAALEAGAPRPSQLRFAAVGGAKVAPSLVARARAAGLPAYEGYGLSECASVVTLNVPGADRPGSVGRALPHIDVRVGDDGEILVSQAGFLGYLGAEERTAMAGCLRTGDLGRLDSAGYLHIEGRRKHLLITSFGRNIAPEWPEAELLAGSAIGQAAVFGEARPQLCAVIVPRAPAVPDAAIEAEVRLANRRLPDYARVACWIRADAPFSPAEGLATPNGRVRRDAVWSRYGARLDATYQTQTGVGTDAVL
jgi:long-subunit acyl-CoA synthetase (AMP-forming)